MRTTVFLVDDHRMMIDGIRRLIADVDRFEIVGEAGDASVAWEQITTLKPQLVIMDLDIRGGDGVTLTRRICSTFSEIKILVLTGRLDLKCVEDSIGAGARGFVLKSNGSTELIAGLDTIAAGDTYLCVDSTTAMLRSTHEWPTGQDDRAVALPERERQVLKLIVEGKRNKEIAAELGIGIKSVETYRSRLMKRMDCSSPAELVRAAIRAGLASA